jgi:hypothetical protein
VATEAAWPKCKTSYREEKEKTDLTLTGLLMEGLGPFVAIGGPSSFVTLKHCRHLFVVTRAPLLDVPEINGSAL